MRPVLALLLALGIASTALAAPPPTLQPKITVNGKTIVVPPASQPAAKILPLPLPPPPHPVAAAVPQPQTPQEAIEAGKSVVSALKAHRWWFASAAGIFLLMFLLNVTGVFKKIGTTWAWVTVGLLSIAAACFAAFDSKGASWSVFLGIVTAGPTTAWLRDFWKDVFLAKCLPWLKGKLGKK